MIQEEFYRELGKLLYAMALADGRIQPREVRILEKAVTAVLKGHCGKSSAGGEVILARLRFGNCIREKVSPAAAERSFIAFVRAHGRAVSRADRETAAFLLHRLAGAFGGEDRKESAMEKRVLKLLHLQ